MFGEMLGIWVQTAIEKLGGMEGVEQLNLVEVGPGSGIMMTDMLRTLQQFNPKLEKFSINLID